MARNNIGEWRKQLSPEEAKAISRKGGLKAGENKRGRVALREELIALLSDGDIQKRMSLVLIQKALDGGRDSIEAFKTIRSTIGEDAPKEVQVLDSLIKVTIDDD